MKKIVTTIAALAMAVSMFAADISAKVKLDGSLLNVNGDNITALTIGHKAQNWNPELSLAANGDNAGASMSFYATGADALSNTSFPIEAQKYSIWFKPFDVLKVTLGHYATNMNEETIDYASTESGLESQGYAFDIESNGFFATAFFAPGWSGSWFKKVDGKTTIADFYFKAGYSADFGRIQAMFRLPKVDKAGNAENIIAGLGYNNTFGSVNMFTNIIFGNNSKADEGYFIRGEAFASTGIDALGIASFIGFGYAGKGATNGGLSGWKTAQPVAGKASLGASLKLTYALDGVTPYLYFKSVNFMADTLGLQIKPGITGNVGTMAWEVACDMNVNGDSFTLDVPVILTVNF